MVADPNGEERFQRHLLTEHCHTAAQTHLSSQYHLTPWMRHLHTGYFARFSATTPFDPDGRSSPQMMPCSLSTACSSPEIQPKIFGVS